MQNDESNVPDEYGGVPKETQDGAEFLHDTGHITRIPRDNRRKPLRLHPFWAWVVIACTAYDSFLAPHSLGSALLVQKMNGAIIIGMTITIQIQANTIIRQYEVIDNQDWIIDQMDKVIRRLSRFIAIITVGGGLHGEDSISEED